MTSIGAQAARAAFGVARVRERNRLDVAIIAVFVFQQAGEYLFPTQVWITYLDKIILCFMALQLILARRRVVARDGLLLAAAGFVAYNLALIAVRGIPLVNAIQILISGKFLVFFYYYATKPLPDRQYLLNRTVRIMTLTLMISVVLAPFELFIAPDLYSALFAVDRDGRGINDSFLTSFFHSRSLYASYLIVVFATFVSMDRPKLIGGISRAARNRWLWIIPVLIYLSYSRKELALLFAFVALYIFRHGFIRSAALKGLLAIVTLAGGMLLLWLIFADINADTIGNDDYIRFALWSNGYNIFEHYFPFGAGPGTYGSLFSRFYQDVYIQFDVPERVFLGYDDVSAPIYDVYIASILAEGGLVGFLLLCFIVKRLGDAVSKQGDGFDGGLFKWLVWSTLLVLVFVTPVLTNLIGYLLCLVLGLLAGQSPGRPSASRIVLCGHGAIRERPP